MAHHYLEASPAYHMPVLQQLTAFPIYSKLLAGHYQLVVITILIIGSACTNRVPPQLLLQLCSGGSKARPKIAWRANTLEWTTRLEQPAHGNWPGAAFPTLPNWPYDSGVHVCPRRLHSTEHSAQRREEEEKTNPNIIDKAAPAWRFSLRSICNTKRSSNSPYRTCPLLSPPLWVNE